MFATPAVAGELVIITSCNGKVYALDPGTGEHRWVFDAAADSGATSYHAETLVHDGLVLVSTDGVDAHLYALDAPTGNLRWKVSTKDGINTDLVVHGDAVIGVKRWEGEGSVVAYALESGEVRWETPVEAIAESPVVINCSPLLIEDRLYYAGSTGYLHVFDPNTGILLERREIGTLATTSLIRFKDGFVFGTEAGALEIWTVDPLGSRQVIHTDETPVRPPIVQEDRIFCLTRLDGEASRMIAIDASRGEELWFAESPLGIYTTARLFQVDGFVIVGTREGMVLALDEADGSLAWILELEGTIRTFAAVGARYVVGTIEGHVRGLDAPGIRDARGH